MSLFNFYMERCKEENYHLGNMLLDCLLRKPPNGIFQIDTATGERETNASVLSRSIQLARSFRKLGLKPGDVLALGGRNHLDLHIPYYAALYNGMPMFGVDPYFKYTEIKLLFKTVKPKIAYCQQEMYEDYKKAIEDLELDTIIVSFDGDSGNFAEIMEIYRENEPIETFSTAEFNKDKIYAWLVSTSGTYGRPKVAALKHQIIMERVIYYIHLNQVKSDGSKTYLHLSPIQWLTSFYNAIGLSMMNICKMQTSKPDDIEHVIDVINEYKPVSTTMSPTLLWSILRHEKHCDLTCFENIMMTGAKPYKELFAKAKARMRPGSVLIEAYGQTETLGPVLKPNPAGPEGTCGVASPATKVKLVNPETGQEITEPNVTGELWCKGPVFTEYYNDPEETEKAFTDGWYKTGDLLYRDENENYFYVDRIKMLIKCRGYHIIPTELEELISSLEGVEEVAVVGIPDPIDGERPVACVVRQPRFDVTSQEIKDLVTSKLSASKQLRGGVIFLEKLPKTSTGKALRHALVKIALQTKK
ncbi:4-coumarate--CoA ligase 1-like [Hyposmocoma kahamanoa]|uniref:4-coumarate--CoA ligase 1-like n=1 Tax=Hyposmocoma kahamanoa TaxID=1477025 RepID=UPI000E6D9DA3|nr:4-coumarate--CoA ligase 1-like [Hyposmocoma kahamanoa]